MIIADLIGYDPENANLGRVYLSTAPFPGDVVRTPDGSFLVTRRVFLDLSEPCDASTRLSVELKVRSVTGLIGYE